MFKHVMVPVDLAGREKLQTAVAVAADQARHYNAKLTLVSVSGGVQPGASTSEHKFHDILDQFAAEVAQQHGIEVEAKMVHSADPTAEIDRLLLRMIEETGADLAVIGSHQPGWSDYIFNSHGGRLASHAPISVFVVRTPH